MVFGRNQEGPRSGRPLEQGHSGDQSHVCAFHTCFSFCPLSIPMPGKKEERICFWSPDIFTGCQSLLPRSLRQRWKPQCLSELTSWRLGSRTLVSLGFTHVLNTNSLDLGDILGGWGTLVGVITGAGLSRLQLPLVLSTLLSGSPWWGSLYLTVLLPWTELPTTPAQWRQLTESVRIHVRKWFPSLRLSGPWWCESY